MAKLSVVHNRPKDTKKTLFRILKYLAAHKYILFLAIILSFVGNVLVLQGPRFAGKAIQEAAAGVGKVNFDSVFYYVRLMLTVYIASSILTIIINVLMTLLSKWIANKMRRDVFDKLMRLKISFFHDNSAGDIISRVSYDVDVVSTCIATDIAQIMTSLVTVIGSFIMMLVILPQLAVIVIITIPISIGYTAYMRKKVRPRYTRRSKSFGAMNGYVEEMLSGEKTIQAYAYEDFACAGFDRVNTEAADAYYDAEYYSCTIGPTMNFINNLSLALIALLGTIFFMGGVASYDAITTFLRY